MIAAKRRLASGTLKIERLIAGEEKNKILTEGEKDAGVTFYSGS